jgi:hypothetical protein
MAKGKSKPGDIVGLLEDLTETEDMVAALRIEYEEMREAALTPKVRAELEAIDAELGERLRHGESRIGTLKGKIKDLVLEHGESMKGGRRHAVFGSGRVSVDTKALQGYAVAHPEVREFITEGNPSVSFRWLEEPVKKGTAK